LTADDRLNAQIKDKISTTRRFAFEEQDAPVIEAQQEMIDAAATAVDPVILAIDVGPVRYKQILQKLIEAEQRRYAMRGAAGIRRADQRRNRDPGKMISAADITAPQRHGSPAKR